MLAPLSTKKCGSVASVSATLDVSVGCHSCEAGSVGHRLVLSCPAHNPFREYLLLPLLQHLHVLLSVFSFRSFRSWVLLCLLPGFPRRRHRISSPYCNTAASINVFPAHSNAQTFRESSDPNLDTPGHFDCLQGVHSWKAACPIVTTATLLLAGNGSTATPAD